MTVVVFRSRLDPEHLDEYGPLAQRMLELAQQQPGFVSFKGFAADDGERVAIIEFETAEHAAAWGRHPEHREAQRAGRDRLYTEFSLQVCEVERDSRSMR